MECSLFGSQIYFKQKKKKGKRQNQEDSLKQIQNVHTSAVQTNRSLANKASSHNSVCAAEEGTLAGGFQVFANAGLRAASER